MLAMTCQLSMADQSPTAQGGATKWGDQREELLTEPTSNDLSSGVLPAYLEITQKPPGHVSEDIGPIVVDEAIESYPAHAFDNPENVHPNVDRDDLDDLIGVVRP
ncbi:hypothetical protein ACFQKF_08405 [Halalkalicoccus sp. GCM10025322]